MRKHTTRLSRFTLARDFRTTNNSVFRSAAEVVGNCWSLLRVQTVFRFVMELAREQDTNTLAVLQYP